MCRKGKMKNSTEDSKHSALDSNHDSTEVEIQEKQEVQVQEKQCEEQQQLLLKPTLKPSVKPPLKPSSDGPLLFHYVVNKLVNVNSFEHLTLEWMEKTTKDLTQCMKILDTKSIIPDMKIWQKAIKKVHKKCYFKNPMRLQKIHAAYTHMLLQESNATIGLWTIPCGSVVPMHSHPARAIGKMVVGKIVSRNGNNECRTYSAGDTFKDTFKVDEMNNLHELTGLDPVNTFIEVVFPSYLTSNDCVYYTFCPLLKKFVPDDLPTDFRTLPSPYFGKNVLE